MKHLEEKFVIEFTRDEIGFIADAFTVFIKAKKSELEEHPGDNRINSDLEKARKLRRDIASLTNTFYMGDE